MNPRARQRHRVILVVAGLVLLVAPWSGALRGIGTIVLLGLIATLFGTTLWASYHEHRRTGRGRLRAAAGGTQTAAGVFLHAGAWRHQPRPQATDTTLAATGPDRRTALRWSSGSSAMAIVTLGATAIGAVPLWGGVSLFAVAMIVALASGMRYLSLR